jgi:hypothetical protein
MGSKRPEEAKTYPKGQMWPNFRLICQIAQNIILEVKETEGLIIICTSSKNLSDQNWPKQVRAQKTVQKVKKSPNNLKYTLILSKKALLKNE